MARRKNQLPSYDIKLVFAASCAAQRINNDYLKFDDTSVTTVDGEVVVTVNRSANKAITKRLINNPTDIIDADYEMAERVISYCNQITFKILADIRISDFERVAMQLATKETTSSLYDIAVISSLPASYLRSLKRVDINERLSDCRGTVGKLGERVSLSGEVMKSFYKEEYGTYFITLITSENQKVIFAFRNNLDVGSMFTFTGKVKKFIGSDTTQLNYVKTV